jgi:hypothetical protein
MNIEQARKQIDKIIYYDTDGMEVKCRITDVKSAYGRILYKIEPLSGSGHKWTAREPGRGLREVTGVGNEL